MAARLITSAVGIVLCIGLMFWGEVNPVVLTIAISLVTGLMCGELLSAKKLHKKLILSIPSVLLGISMPLLSSTDFVFVPLYLFTVLVFVSAVLYHKDITADDMMFAFGGTLLVTLSMTSFAYTVCGEAGLYPLIKATDNVKNYPSFWIVLTLAIPWMADSGAYFVGRFLGKHKLCEAISPKKTIEGAVGGLISGFIASILIGFIFTWIYKDVTISFVPLILIGVINPVISIFGDLTFSIIKRSCNVKDYGSIMPGHGGMLDRFDSIILCAPLVFLVSQFFTVIS